MKSNRCNSPNKALSLAEASSGRGLIRRLADIFFGTMVSRVLGFAREVVISAYFGTGWGMDAFVAAFTVPSLVRRILGEEICERALIPPSKSRMERGDLAGGWKMASVIFNWLLLCLLTAMVLLYLVGPLLVRIIVPGLSSEAMSWAIRMTYVIMPFLVFIGIAAYVGMLLNFFKRTMVFAASPAMLSLGVILSVWLLRSKLGLYCLPVGFVLGAMLQTLVQLPFLFSHSMRTEQGFRFHLALRYPREAGEHLRREASFVVIQSLFEKTIEVVDRILASLLVSGSMSSLWYAFRLREVPRAALGMAISRAVVSDLNRWTALGRFDLFREDIVRSLKINLYLIVPVTFMSVALARPLVGMVFQRGAFDERSTSLTTVALVCYLAGLLALSVYNLMKNAFGVLQMNSVLLRTSLWAWGLNVALNILLVQTSLRHGGLALASSLSYTVQVIILLSLLQRELRIRGAPISWKPLGTEGLRSLIAGIAGGSASYGCRLVVEPAILAWAATPFWGFSMQVFLGGAAGLAVYCAVVLMFHPHLVARWKERRRGRKAPGSG
ncbi:MAG: murein biosynthesis integral membrane protein MurJ [Deltaproteobacteria bacterium]|nr:murein biosynthesis integral membrane protein MurJ [Deltaproteobacteria bacterium]